MHWPAKTPTWKARWISLPTHLRAGTNVYLRARTSFNRDDRVATPFIVHVAAESSYRLSVNGTFLGHGPVRGTRALNFFDSYDLSRVQRPGSNWIVVEAYCPNVPTFRAAPAMPAVFLQSDDGWIRTDDTWEVQACPDWRRDVPLYNFQTGYMEWNDTRQQDDKWLPAVVVSDSEKIAGKLLLPRDVPPLSIKSRRPVSVPVQACVPARSAFPETHVAERMTIEPHSSCIFDAAILQSLQETGRSVRVTPTAGVDGAVLVFDFRDSVNGWFEIELSGPPGTIVDVGYEEELVNNRLNLVHFSYRFADRYILRGGRQKVGNCFTTRGFRLVQVALRDFSAPIEIHRVEGFDALYPYEHCGSFHSSDDGLNKLWNACVNTLRQCTTDTLVDCPWRENTLYFNDMLVEALTSLQTFGDARLIRRCYRLALSQPSPTRLLPAAVPAGVIQEMDHATSVDRITLPSSNLLLPWMLEEYLLYSGDAELVRGCEATVRGILETVATWEDQAGLITSPKRYWNMIDWSYPQDSLDGVCTATLNWMYVSALHAAARLAEQFDWAFNPDELREKAARLAFETDRRFWNADERAYVEHFDDAARPALFSQLASAAAILSGGLPDKRAKDCVAAVKRQDFLAPELFMHHFVLRALTRQGEAQAALDRVRQYWMPIVGSGSSTIWEMGVHQHGKAAFDGAGSLCHGFSTTPIDLLQVTILGVCPTTPAFGRFSISPMPLDLTFARGTVPTPHGDIGIEWRKQDGQLELKVDVPCGTTGTLSDGRILSPGRHELTIPLPQPEMN